MPTQNLAKDENLDPEEQLFQAILAKDLDKVKEIHKAHPKINLNCIDKDELTPLQHACHTGNLQLAKFLLDNQAGVDFTRRKDGYTPLMFAAISARADIVRLLLEHRTDITIENCVNRNAAQMAAFVGQSKIVSIINSWIPFESSIEPFTRCRELENRPRISSMELAKMLHDYVVYPSLHPVKIMLYIKENPDLVKNALELTFVLDTLCSKSLRPPQNDETLSLKYYYLCYLLQYCRKAYDAKFPSNLNNNGDPTFHFQACDKCIETICRRLIKRESASDQRPFTKQLDQFILNCVLKFPYTQLAIFKTMTFALAKLDADHLTALSVLTQTLNGPRMFGQIEEACAICGETDKNKKCSKCKSIYYCGPLCQSIDWFQHKKYCHSPEETPLISPTEGDEDNI